MSLDNPTKVERAVAMYKAWPVTAKIAVPLGVLLLVVGFVLFNIDRLERWTGTRAIDHAKTNVNIALADVNAGKAVVANDRVNEAVAVEQVKQAANDVITASNATDDAKAAAKQAVANYVAAKQANVPTGTTEEDLQRKLDELDK